MGEVYSVMGAPEQVEAVVAESFDDVYRAGHDGMVRLAYLMVGSVGVAEELVHDGFIRLHRNWDRVEHPRAFLRVTVVNLCLSWRRRERRARDRAPLLVEPGPFGDDRLDPLWDALAKLRPERRVALVLRYYGQLNSVEIGEVLGCPSATVRTRLHRGLADLRKEIER